MICPLCRKELAARAASCVHCGAALEGTPRRARKRMGLKVMILVSIAHFLYAGFKGGYNDTGWVGIGWENPLIVIVKAAGYFIVSFAVTRLLRGWMTGSAPPRVNAAFLWAFVCAGVLGMSRALFGDDGGFPEIVSGGLSTQWPGLVRLVGTSVAGGAAAGAGAAAAGGGSGGVAVPGRVTIYLTGQAARDALSRGVGGTIGIPGDQQHMLDVRGDGFIHQEGHFGDKGRIRSIGPIARGPDGEIAIAVDVEHPDAPVPPPQQQDPDPVKHDTPPPKEKPKQKEDPREKLRDECGDRLYGHDDQINGLKNSIRASIDEFNQLTKKQLDIRLAETEARMLVLQAELALDKVTYMVAKPVAKTLGAAAGWTLLAYALKSTKNAALVVIGYGINLWRAGKLVHTVTTYWQEIKMAYQVAPHLPKAYRMLQQLRTMANDMLRDLDNAARALDPLLQAKQAEIQAKKVQLDAAWHARESTYRSCQGQSALPRGAWRRPRPTYNYDATGNIIGVI